jgi:hypothetical protein
MPWAMVKLRSDGELAPFFLDKYFHDRFKRPSEPMATAGVRAAIFLNLLRDKQAERDADSGGDPLHGAPLKGWENV